MQAVLPLTWQGWHPPWWHHRGMIPRLAAHAVQCTFHTTQKCEFLTGGGTLEKLCNELLCNCFVIAKRIEPLPPSPQLRRSVGAKIIYRQNALKRLTGLRVEIDLFSPLVFLFCLTRLCYIFLLVISLSGSVAVFFSHLLYTLLQLRYITTYHHCIAALGGVTDWSLWPRPPDSWLRVVYNLFVRSIQWLDHLAEQHTGQWGEGAGSVSCHCSADSLTLVTHHEFAACIKSLSNRWSHKLHLNWFCHLFFRTQR